MLPLDLVLHPVVVLLAVAVTLVLVSGQAARLVELCEDRFPTQAGTRSRTDTARRSLSTQSGDR